VPGALPAKEAVKTDSKRSAVRTRSLLLIAGFVTTVASALLVLFTPMLEHLPGLLPWLLASGAFALAAWYFEDGPPSDVLASLAALMALAAIYPAPGPADPSMILVASSIVVLWAALVLRPSLAVVIAAFALGGPWLFDLQLTMNFGSPTAGEINIALHLAAIALPFSLALILRRQQDELSLVLASDAKWSHRREDELNGKLERKNQELELVQEKLAQAQKLETVGTMASGLAHELNNLLVPIRGLAEIVALSSEDDKTQHHGRRILEAAESAAAITGALLTYARQGSFAPIRTNLRHLIEKQVFPVLSRSIPEAIDVELELAEHLACDVDRVMLQQALTNLVFNAVDAMPQGGKLKIRLTAEPAREGLGRALLEVIDEGEGMTDEVIEHIFDPFFTTKEVGSGTGLGLAMVHGCVVRHGGEVKVDSVVGGGSHFSLAFPLAQERKPSRPWPILGERRDRPIVVVASPDVDTLDVLEEMLHDLEITPICTSELAGVRTMLAEVGDRVNVLMTDLADDIEGTRRLVRDARRLRPDLPIIAISARPPDPSMHRLSGPGPLRVARGPVDRQMMATLLSDLLRPEGYELPYWALPSSASGSHMSSSQVDLSMTTSSVD
jgi:signal transduction histidine kinase